MIMEVIILQACGSFSAMPPIPTYTHWKTAAALAPSGTCR